MRMFNVNKEYKARLIGDSELICSFIVIKRTDKRITLKDNEELITVAIKKDKNGNEFCLPLGNYSKAPILRA